VWLKIQAVQDMALMSLGKKNSMILTMSHQTGLEFSRKLLTEAVVFTFSIKIRDTFAGFRQVSK